MGACISCALMYLRVTEMTFLHIVVFRVNPTEKCQDADLCESENEVESGNPTSMTVSVTFSRVLLKVL